MIDICRICDGPLGFFNYFFCIIGGGGFWMCRKCEKKLKYIIYVDYPYYGYERYDRRRISVEDLEKMVVDNFELFQWMILTERT